MKQSLITAAVFSALFAEADKGSAGPGSTSVEVKTSGPVQSSAPTPAPEIDSWAKIGTEYGNKETVLSRESEKSQKEIRIDAASKLLKANDDQTKAFMDAYASVLITYHTSDTTRTKKAEMYAAIKAARVPRIDYPIGLNDNKEVMYESFTGLGLMRALAFELKDGQSGKVRDFRAWRDMVSRIQRVKQDGPTAYRLDVGNTDSSKKLPQKVTEKGMDKVENTVKVLDPKQASQVAPAIVRKLNADDAASVASDVVEKLDQKGLEQIADQAISKLQVLLPEAWEHRTLARIENDLNRIMESSNKDTYKQVASAAAAILHEFFTEQSQIAAASAKIGAETPESGGIEMPKPAEGEVKAA